jgi:hypothetical protein
MGEAPLFPLDDPARVPPDAARFASAVFLGVGDVLVITSWNAATGVTLSVEGRLLTRNGDVKSFARSHTPNTDRTAASAVLALGEGWLLNLQVRASAGSPIRGQCFVLVELALGAQTQQTRIGTLLQGYVTATQRRAWPGSLIEASIDGSGAIRIITGSDPAAGAEISETVPTGARWQLLALTASLVADANAANRIASLLFDDGASVYARMSAQFAQAANNSAVYTWGAGLQFQGNVNADPKVSGLPIDHRLLAGHRLRTIVNSIQVGDNWGAPVYCVQEWIDVNA